MLELIENFHFIYFCLLWHILVAFSRRHLLFILAYLFLCILTDNDGLIANQIPQLLDLIILLVL